MLTAEWLHLVPYFSTKCYNSDCKYIVDTLGVRHGFIFFGYTYTYIEKCLQRASRYSLWWCHEKRVSCSIPDIRGQCLGGEELRGEWHLLPPHSPSCERSSHCCTLGSWSTIYETATVWSLTARIFWRSIKFNLYNQKVLLPNCWKKNTKFLLTSSIILPNLENLY